MQRGYNEIVLYRNEGNAWLLAADLPKAILAYRHGLALESADWHLQDCLEFARSRVVYHQPENLGRPPVASAWWLIMHAVYFPGLVGLTLSAAALGSFALMSWWGFGGRRMVYIVTTLFGFAAVFGGGTACRAWEYRQAQATPAVVVTHDGVMLRSGNGSSYPVKFDAALNRGVEAQLLFTRGDWLQIELMTGEAGWVPRQAVVQ
jgi:hypothetical protein